MNFNTKTKQLSATDNDAQMQANATKYGTKDTVQFSTVFYFNYNIINAQLILGYLNLNVTIYLLMSHI